MIDELRWWSVPAAVVVVVLGLLWLIQGLAAEAEGPLSGGWWKGPILSIAAIWFLAWRWKHP